MVDLCLKRLTDLFPMSSLLEQRECFLNYVDRSQEQDELVRKWISSRCLLRDRGCYRDLVLWSGRNISALRYHDIPYNLKLCFLYLGSLPEYWEISKRKLIRLWIAEGFIPTQKNEAKETLEEAAERYLEELIDRCMVQVDQRDHTGIGVKTCRIHDRMWDFCISKAKEENFIEIVEDPNQLNTEHLT